MKACGVLAGPDSSRSAEEIDTNNGGRKISKITELRLGKKSKRRTPKRPPASGISERTGESDPKCVKQKKEGGQKTKPTLQLGSELNRISHFSWLP